MRVAPDLRRGDDYTLAAVRQLLHDACPRILIKPLRAWDDEQTEAEPGVHL